MTIFFHQVDICMNYDFLQPQLFRLLTQRLDCYQQPSSGILGRLVLPLLTRESVAVEHKSAITDQADRNNCIIYWKGAKVIDRERNRNTKRIKEAIWIQKATPVKNRDGWGEID